MRITQIKPTHSKYNVSIKIKDIPPAPPPSRKLREGEFVAGEFKRDLIIVLSHDLI